MRFYLGCLCKMRKQLFSLAVFLYWVLSVSLSIGYCFHSILCHPSVELSAFFGIIELTEKAKRAAIAHKPKKLGIMYMEYPIMIEINGYVTETQGKARFMIKIMNDNIDDEKGNHPGVSKEKSVFIPRALYPNDYHDHFEIVKDNEYLMEKIGECWSRCKELRKGDRVECVVFIVEEEVRNGVTTYNINRNRNDIETYTKFELWLYPDPQSFKRLEVDSRESLKFRKQWRYTCINREKCGKITGYGYKYRSRRWINKNPTIIFPIIGWIWIKTNLFNLWNRFTRQKDPPQTIAHKLAIIGIAATIVVGIIGIIVTIIIAIWFR